MRIETCCSRLRRRFVLAAAVCTLPINAGGGFVRHRPRCVGLSWHSFTAEPEGLQLYELFESAVSEGQLVAARALFDERVKGHACDGMRLNVGLDRGVNFVEVGRVLHHGHDRE